MIKIRLDGTPIYGYVKTRSSVITANKSILERAVLTDGLYKVPSVKSVKSNEKVAKINLGKKQRKRFG